MDIERLRVWILSLDIIRPTVVGSGDAACDEDASTLSPSGDGIGQNLPLFGSKMHPSELLSGMELEDGIAYDKIVLSTYAEKTKTVVIAVHMGPYFQSLDSTIKRYSPLGH